MDDFSKSSEREEKNALKTKSICYVPIGPLYKTGAKFYSVGK